MGLSDHTKESREAFEQSIVKSPEVCECHNITGAFEYLLRVEVTKLAAYKVFHTDVPGTMPPGELDYHLRGDGFCKG